MQFDDLNKVVDSSFEELDKGLESFIPSFVLNEVGYVTSVSAGIVKVSGLPGVGFEELLKFPGNIFGIAFNIDEDEIGVILLGEDSKINAGDEVERTGRVMDVPVGDALIGRVINPLGEPLDEKNAIIITKRLPIERPAHAIMDRAQVTVPMQTGLKVIDALIPVGRGQRELILGDRQTGKTAIAIDTIINQKMFYEKGEPVACIYVAIGQKESKTAKIVAQLAEAGAMEYTIVVTAPASSPAAFQFLAPFAGATIGEVFMEQGKDALVIYDDLSKHAVAYRQMSLLLRRPPGREAYPGDVFYLHSRLLERAAKLSKEKGGGSLTALPIIETQEGDISAYIPTNVISITDGQIFLLADLFNKGQRPAIDVGNSVSRVGSSAQTKAMKKVSGKIKLQLAQFRELEAFMQFASDLDADTKRQIDDGRRMTEVLKQNVGEPLAFEMQAAVIFAATNGYFDSFTPDETNAQEKRLQDYLNRDADDVLTAIRTEKAISEETEAKLRSILEKFVARTA